jgi:hypothetical protein
MIRPNSPLSLESSSQTLQSLLSLAKYFAIWREQREELMNPDAVRSDYSRNKQEIREIRLQCSSTGVMVNGLRSGNGTRCK